MRLVYILLVLSAPSAAAQRVLSATSGGGPSSDVAEAVAAGQDGAVYVAGTFEGTADFGNGISATSAGDSDAFLVKYDAAGDAVWARRAGTDVFNDFGEGVAVAESGAVYLAGTFTGIATFDGGARPDTSITTRNDFDAFLARYTADGDLDWVRRVGGPLQDVGRAVAVQPSFENDGAVALVGSFTGSAEAGDTTLTSAGGSDAFAAVFDAAGTLLWARSAGGTDSDVAYDAAFAFEADTLPGSGALYLAGQFSGVAVFGPGVAVQSAGLGDAFVARYGRDGAPRWAARVGGAGSDYARGLALAALGEAGEGVPGEPYVYLGGSFSDAMLVGSDVLQSAGFTDAFLAAFDADGAPVWGRRGGGPGFDFVEDVTTLGAYAVPLSRSNASTPVYLVGYIDGAADFAGPDTSVAVAGAGGQDGFVAAYSAGDYSDTGTGGRLLEAFPVGGPDRDTATGVAVRPQSSAPYERELNPVIAGAFRSSIALPGFGTLTSVGSNDLFVAELASCPAFFCLPTDAEPGAETSALALAAAPNPFTRSATITLALPAPGAARVAAYDVLGREVAVLHEGPLAAGRHPLALEGGLAPGLYLVRATAGGGSVTVRVTKSR